MQNYVNTAKELSTIRDFIRWAISQMNEAHVFLGHGTDNIWDEAVHLISHVLHLPPDVNKEVLDARLTESERTKIAELLWRRISERIPAPYLTNEAWFAGIPFFVDQRVLIPRSPVAELIEKQFEPWVDLEKVHNILDLGTGSGCIAIACAIFFPFSHVDASDVSKDALNVAKINVDKYHLEGRVTLIESDIFSNLKGKKYDVIISNPPYVDQNDMGTLPPEYLHEPKMALASGVDGLNAVDGILRGAYSHLTDQGILIVEVGNSAKALIEKYPKVPFVWLEFERGDSDVFLLRNEDLQSF
jgi:ribosomal protein L3 glutamine methyltransferase